MYAIYVDALNCGIIYVSAFIL